MENKSIRFLALKIIGSVAIAIEIAGIIMLIVNLFGDSSTGLLVASLIMIAFGILCGVPCLFIGFWPQFLALKNVAMQQIQDHDMYMMNELSAASAQASASTSSSSNDYNKKTTQKTSSENIGKKIYCKHCGAEIDDDSKFCAVCSKEL